MQVLTDQDSYKNYMNAVAASHVDLNWFKFGDEEDIKLTGNADMNSLGLWADEQKPVGIEGAQHDNFMAQYEAPLFIMTPQRPKVEDRQTDYHICEGIARDILSKMIADYQAGIINSNFNRCKWGEVIMTFGANKYTACRLDIHWAESADLTLNQAKWQ